MNPKFNQYIISQNETIISAFRKINDCSDGQAYTLFVVDDDSRVIGSLTDGDVRRVLVTGASVNDNVTCAMRTDFHYISDINDYKQIKLLKSFNLKAVPLLSADRKILDIINLKDIRAILPVDAVIMAGGKGIRLKPYTDNVPKAMLDLNGKPIIAHNIDRLIQYGVRNFYASVNHLKDCIKEYLNNHYQHINIQYIEEDKPLGTIGSVKLAKGFIHDDILVMNADILTNINFDDFYCRYKETKNDMSVATFNVKIDVPYAVLNIYDDKINSFVEKPAYTYYSNAGIYLINKNCIDIIPNNEVFDATDFIDSMIKINKCIGHFPIMGYWLDVGTIQNYSKAKDDIKYVRF
ncbi:MAG: NTP transferase domain-containing protein [Holosporaceae bacterium]|jgi:dTDP-glucose pyrophosphorylase|nr:NTP transferase domain-containing protein [Holosporaceae bacterium]